MAADSERADALAALPKAAWQETVVQARKMLADLEGQRLRTRDEIDAFRVSLDPFEDFFCQWRP